MFNHLSIATKLQFMSWLASLLLISVSILGYFALDSVGTAARRMGQGKDVVADILPPPLYLVEAQLIAKTLLTDRDGDKQQLIGRLRELKSDYDKRNDYWTSSLDIPSEVKQALLGNQRNQADLWWQELEHSFIPAHNQKDTNTMQASMLNLDNFYLQHRRAIDETIKISSEFANDTFNELGQVGNRTTALLISVAIIGALISLVMAYIVIRQIRFNLGRASDFAQAIADGDLTISIASHGHDEIGQLLDKLSLMRNKLHALISEMHIGVYQLSHHSTELLDAASNGAMLAQNESETACSMAASIEELSVSLDQVDHNAEEARRVAYESGLRAQESTKVIGSTIEEMQHISEVVLNAANNIRDLEAISSEITSIVNVIHGVADQTNLLALNAAIEAARAGEYGRGFAVVADEVRTLAERTSSSSAEIKLMVEKIRDASQAAVLAMENGVKGVESGVALSRDAGKSVREILQAQSQVTNSIDGISDALKEQATATREITKRVETVSQGAESLAATASQTKSSAKELAQQAKTLDKLAARFKL